MVEADDLKSLIFTRTLYVPIAKKELFNAILLELNKFFPPIIIEPWYFYQDAWLSSQSEEYMDFSLKLKFFYIFRNLSLSEPPQLRECERLRTEFKKNVNKIIADTPSYINNGYPFNLHIDLLKTDESGCEIEIECHPFLYYNIANFKAKVDNLENQRALLMCERYLKTLAVGLKAKEIDKTASDIAKFTKFLGIDKNWMSATYALQLQEVSITLVAKKKNIALDRKNVERILNKEIKANEGFFSYQYEAFAKEVKRLYDIEIPFMAMWLRKMRQVVLHEGHNPTEQENRQVISATVCLLKELKKVWEAEPVTQNSDNKQPNALS